MVPEVAFHPSDIGLQQAGIAEAVAQVLQSVPPSLHELLCSNVILTGKLNGLVGTHTPLTTWASCKHITSVVGIFQHMRMQD